jgi:hypothetical protein
MTATIKATISPFAQAKTEFDSNPMHFLNEDLASVPVSGIPVLAGDRACSKIGCS